MVVDGGWWRYEVATLAMTAFSNDRSNEHTGAHGPIMTDAWPQLVQRSSVAV